MKKINTELLRGWENRLSDLSTILDGADDKALRNIACVLARIQNEIEALRMEISPDAQNEE